ncbi:hypothetical protein CDAR_582651 [Caerostris darwini]|uniref:Uncharacterized protein n=1 Tax=Caerostris darwini TaxID=1538125 RepID=A0AAV4PM91_9ARAC|nr:hypothetical protein CDAR_582651 [Caerostris darwini]
MTNDAAFYFSNLELLVKENPSTKDIPEFIITTCMRNSGTQTPLLYAMARSKVQSLRSFVVETSAAGKRVFVCKDTPRKGVEINGDSVHQHLYRDDDKTVMQSGTALTPELIISPLCDGRINLKI